MKKENNNRASSIRGILFTIGLGMALTGYHYAIVAGICFMFFATFIPFPLWYFPNPDQTGVGMSRKLKDQEDRAGFEMEFKGGEITGVKTSE